MELANHHTPKITNRLNWMDWAKALGMFLVILGHVYRGNDELKTTIYSFHMPLFFLISGFLHRQDTNFFSALKKNYRSIIIPFLWFNLFWIIYIILPDIFIHKKNIVDAIIDPIKLFFSGFYTTLFAFGYSWFLLALFFCKMFFNFLQKIDKPFYLGFIIASLVILLYVYTLYTNFQLFNIGSALLALPYFAMGYFLKKHKIFDKIIGKNTLLLLITASLFLFTFFLAQYNGKVRMDQIMYGKNFLLFYLIGFSGTIATITFCLLLDKISLNIIQKISIGNLIIMGTHGMILYFYWIVFRDGGYIQISLLEKIVVSIVVMILEIPIIMFIEQKMPFVLGKKFK